MSTMYSILILILLIQLNVLVLLQILCIFDWWPREKILVVSSLRCSEGDLCFASVLLIIFQNFAMI